MVTIEEVIDSMKEVKKDTYYCLHNKFTNKFIIKTGLAESGLVISKSEYGLYSYYEFSNAEGYELVILNKADLLNLCIANKISLIFLVNGSIAKAVQLI